MDELSGEAKQGTSHHEAFERSILNLFESVFVEYPDEPLVKLLRSNYFKADDSSTLMGLSLTRIKIFLILSSQAES